MIDRIAKKIMTRPVVKFINVRNTLILLTKVQAQDITGLLIYTFQARIFQQGWAVQRKRASKKEIFRISSAVRRTAESKALKRVSVFLYMPELITILTEEEIGAIVESLARKISRDYKDKPLVLIGVLKGAFIFLGDLARRLTIPVEIDFIQFSSYGKKDSSSGEVQLQKEITSEISGKDVLVVEDIIDTGRTMTRLIQHLKSFGPNSIRVCVFIEKYERREVDYKADYACYSVEGGFLVGYGLDYAEKYRNLPALYHLNF